MCGWAAGDWKAGDGVVDHISTKKLAHKSCHVCCAGSSRLQLAGRGTDHFRHSRVI